MLVKVSRLVVFFWRHGKFVCDDPVTHHQFALSEPASRLLRLFADWQPIERAESSLPLAEQLLGAGILISKDSPRCVLEESLSALPEMGSAATYFHLASHTLRDDPFLTAAEDGQDLRERIQSDPPPPVYKSYPGPLLALPPGAGLDIDLAEALRLRRSSRVFRSERSITLAELSALLHWAAGVLHEIDVPWLGPIPLKASPSAGARHPVEIYPLVRDVSGVPPGVYHYAPRSHALSRLPGELPALAEIIELGGGQPHAGTAGVLFLFTGVLGRTAWKYPNNRAYRDVYLDAGHVSQTLYLAATGLGLGAFFTAAIRDEIAETILDLPWTEEIPIGLTGIGIPTPRPTTEPAFSIPEHPWYTPTPSPTSTPDPRTSHTPQLTPTPDPRPSRIPHLTPTSDPRPSRIPDGPHASATSGRPRPSTPEVPRSSDDVGGSRG